MTDTTERVQKRVDQLSIEIHPDRRSAGQAAAAVAATELRTVLGEKAAARVVFAAAPSQDEMLETLAATPGIDWRRVVAFHMDEYLGLDDDAPQRFSRYLKKHLFDMLPFAEVRLISGDAPDEICERYARELRSAPIDLVCMGVGENGHIAFNDPPVADFDDPEWVKVVELDLACRRQQVNDGCFPDLESVPKRAITLTVPALMSGNCLICTVPGRRKSRAVRRMLTDTISTECPASILRTHPRCFLFVDRDCWNGNDEPR